MDWATLADIIVAVTAIYAAFLSTWTFIAQQRAKRPQIAVKLESLSFMQQRDSYGQVKRVLLASFEEQDGSWEQIDVISVDVVNRGQREVVLTEWGIMLLNKTVLFSNEIRGTQAQLLSGRRFEREITLEKLTGTVRSNLIHRLRLRIIGFYRDELGNTYKSRRVKPTADVKRVLLNSNTRE